MATRPIQVGDYVIATDCDRPCLKLAAVIRELDGLRFAEYICYPANVPAVLFLDEVTLIEDFGVDLTFENGAVTATKARESIAEYHDKKGGTRRWQGDSVETRELRPQKQVTRNQVAKWKRESALRQQQEVADA